MNTLPTGTVTFLFTDIEGSTQLAQQVPDALPALLARHHAVLHNAIESHNGYVFQIIGDAFCAAFHTAYDALDAAVDAQRGLQQKDWQPTSLKVRMGIHTGAAQYGAIEERAGGYVGYLTLTRAQRVMSVAYGEQILLSNSAAELVRGDLPTSVTLHDMAEHRLKGLVNPEHLWQLVVPDLRQDFPPLQSLNAIPNNLPVLLTSFIGREKEITEIRQELTEHRLVTLTGSGGTGKTRLSLQVAADVLDRFPNGVWFVELAPLTDPDMIPQTILSAIGLNEQVGKSPKGLLQEYLREKKVLIVLDNCEHLIEASAQLVNTLLSSAPELRFLASSREALGVRGELSFPVPSLSMPNPKQTRSMEQLLQYEAVRLFMDRAALVAPHFAMTKENASAILQICYRLDGIPLAIELAAARVKILSVEEISKRLDDRFRLLTGGARTALPRQQTLRALIDWSYDLLPDNERLLLRRLSVFAGGWTLEAAEFVCAGETLYDVDVLELLAHLVNKSLVLMMEPSHHQETRYRMLETIRQYAREKLMESREGDALRDKHLDYYLQVAQKAKPEFFTAKELRWLVWLENEWGNLRAAVEWSLEKRADAGLELVNALGYFLEDHFYMSDLETWVSQLVPHIQNSARTVRRAQGLLHWAYCIAAGHTDASPVRTMLQESASIYQELNDQNGLAHYFLKQAGISTEHQTIISLYEKALALFRETQDKPWIANTLFYFGWSLDANAYARKISCLEESLELYQELEYSSGIIETSKQLGALELRLGRLKEAHRWLDKGFSIMQAHASDLGNSKTMAYDLGDLAFYEGNYELAQNYYKESLAWANQKGFPFAVNWARVRLAYALLRNNQAKAAYESFSEALLSFSASDNALTVGFIPEGIIFTLEGLAALAVTQARYDKGATLIGWADEAREKGNYPRPPIEQAAIERETALIHSQLDDAAFEAAMQSSRAMTQQDIISYALAPKRETDQRNPQDDSTHRPTDI